MIANKSKDTNWAIQDYIHAFIHSTNIYLCIEQSATHYIESGLQNQHEHSFPRE